MIKAIALLLLLVSPLSWAGLPPTTSKGFGDSANKTTFNYQFPDNNTQHNGTTAIIKSNGPKNFVANPSGLLTANNWTKTQVTVPTTGNITNGSNCIASPGTLTGISVNMPVGDGGIPNKIPLGAYVAGLPGACSAGQIQMSANATGNVTGASLTFGGSVFQQDTTPGTGIGGTNYSLYFKAGNAGDYAQSDAMTLDNDVTGNCQVRGSYNTTSALYTLTLMNGSTALTTPLALSATSGYADFPQPFNYPCASGYSIRVAATAAALNPINFGNVSWGKATNMGMVNVSTAPAAYTPTSQGLGTLANVSVYWQRSENRVIVWGRATTGTVTASEAYIGLPPGAVIAATESTYRIFGDLGRGVSASGSYYLGGVAGDAYLRVSVQAAGNHALNTLTGNAAFGSAENFAFFASVPIQGWTSQLAATVDTTASTWSGTVSGTGTSTGTGANIALSGSAGTVATISNQNLTCVAGAAAQSISCPLAIAGKYEVCSYGTFTNSGITTDYMNIATSAGAAVSGGTNGYVTGAGANSPYGLCGQYTASAAGSVQFQIYGAVGSGTGTWGSNSWTVKALTQNLPAPVILNQVSTRRQNGLYVESAFVAHTGDKTDNALAGNTALFDQTDGITAVTYNATGAYTLTFATSATWQCICSANRRGYGNASCSPVPEAATATSYKVTTGQSGTSYDAQFSVICTGLK